MRAINFRRGNANLISNRPSVIPSFGSRSSFSFSTEATESEEVSSHRKIIKLKEQRFIVQQQRKRNAEFEEKAKQLGLGWRIVGSTILHRYPTVIPQLEPWEAEMSELREKLDDLKRMEFMKEVEGTDAAIFTEANPSYKEILESMPFQPASVTTEADLSNDRQSLDRNLTGSLYFIVKRNRAGNAWQFPQGKIKEGESLRQTTERVIARATGKIGTWFISNAPVGHYCYEYSPEEQQSRKEFGAKVYFYRCQLLSGTVKLETRLYKDFAWVNREEAKEYFPTEMQDFIASVLPMDPVSEGSTSD